MKFDVDDGADSGDHEDKSVEQSSKAWQKQLHKHLRTVTPVEEHFDDCGDDDSPLREADHRPEALFIGLETAENAPSETSEQAEIQELYDSTFVQWHLID